MEKRIIIAGSRHFTDRVLFEQVVDAYLGALDAAYEPIILSGHCSGADLLAEQYAKERQIRLEVFPAEWKRYKKGAGPIRNRQMVKAADAVIAFFSGGKGTASLLSLAEKRGLELNVIPVED